MSYVQGPSGNVQVQGVEGIGIAGSQSSAVEAGIRAQGRGADVTVDIDTYDTGIFSDTQGNVRVHIPEPGKDVQQTIESIINRLSDLGMSSSEIAVALNVITEALDKAPEGRPSTVHMFIGS